MPNQEMSHAARQYLKHGELIDSLGFNGDAPDFDSLEFFRLADELFADQNFNDAESELYQDAMQEERFHMRHYFYQDDEIASFMFGMVTGVITLHPVKQLHVSASMKLIERAVEGVRLTRMTYGYGDEHLFEGGYEKGHRILSTLYKLKTQRLLPEHLDALVRNRKQSGNRRMIGRLGLGYQREQQILSSNPPSFIVEHILREAQDQADSEETQGRDDA